LNKVSEEKKMEEIKMPIIKSFQKGLSSFINSKEESEKLNTEKSCDKGQFLESKTKFMERRLISSSLINLPSSSEKAVVASSLEQVDKRRVENLSQLILAYASLVFNILLEKLSRLGSLRDKSLEGKFQNIQISYKLIYNSLDSFNLSYRFRRSHN